MSGTTASTVVSCQKNKTPLNTVIPVTALGPIAMNGTYPTFAELITAVQGKNPAAGNLNANNVRLFGQPGPTSARLQGIRDYNGFVIVTYSNGGPAPVEHDLTKIITQTNLGAIVMATAGSPTPEELLRGIIDANPTRAGSLTTADFTASNVTATGATITGTNGYTGTVNVTYTRETNLANIIETTNLGTIVNTNYPNGPSVADLLNGIKKAKNPKAASLAANSFTISGTDTATAATIQGANGYTGTVNLTYTSETNISKLITNLNLGAITMAGATPTPAELITGIKAANNPNAAGLTAANIAITGSATATQATIQGVSPYTGSVVLHYTKA